MIIPEGAYKIILNLEHNSHDAFVVGGCVRDSILGRTPGDWDITTDAKPEEVKELFSRTVDTGIEHGTVTVLMSTGKRRPDGSFEPYEKYEVTTYRVDGDYSDHRRPDSVEFTDDLLEDLRRRDFTINAMAYNPKVGLVDEFHGIEDLNEGIVRCVGNADERFDEDALRILRAIRFSAQLGFGIEGKTYEAIKNHAADLVNVSAERILIELNKTLASRHPERMKLIWELGLNEYIAPSFYLIKDTSGIVPGKSSSWAALMRNLDPADAKKILKELKSDNETVDNTVALVAEYKLPMPTTPQQVRTTLNHIGPDLFEDLITMFEERDSCDYHWIREMKMNAVQKGECYTLKQLDLSGDDLKKLGYSAGPDIGRILNGLLAMVIEDPTLNEKEKLLKLAKEV